MDERQEYQMSQEQLERLLKASQPVMCLIIGGRLPSSPQENANRAWQALAQEMGFQWDTVQPVPGGDHKRFTAVPVREEAVDG